MIEEFMLAANVSVAEKIVNQFPQFSLLRYSYVTGISFVKGNTLWSCFLQKYRMNCLEGLSIVTMTCMSQRKVLGQQCKEELEKKSALLSLK